MVRAYFRCPGGHYFEGMECPFDGWSSPEAENYASAAEKLRLQNQPATLAALRAQGLSDVALRRIIAIEFGHDGAVFDAMSPDIYMKNGEVWHPGNLST
jgi:hypothetical protein